MHDILTIADDWQSWPANVLYAAELAALIDGTLTGLYIAPLPIQVPDVGSASLFAELVEITQEQAAAADRAEGAFKVWAAALGVPRSAWYVSRSSIDDALKSASDWHDVLVVGREPETNWATVNDVGRLLLTLGLPCVLVPAHFKGPARLDTIGVAWNGSPESLRALHSALPLLRRARRIVLIRDQGSVAVATLDWNPTIQIEAYLAWQGLTVAPTSVDAGDAREQGAILAAAMRAGVDLLVMGAYGRGRFSEWAFGGATRHALEHAKIPLFMRH